MGSAGARSDASWLRWGVLLATLAVAALVPWPLLTLAASAPLWLGYVACRRAERPELEVLVAYALGGLCTGAGVAAIVFADWLGGEIARFTLPPAIWIGTRLLFLWIEARYASHASEPGRAEETEAPGAPPVSDPFDVPGSSRRE